MMKIGDLLGRRRFTQTLTEEEAGPNSFGVRQAWDTSQVASSLKPQTLATIMKSAIAGDARAYLTLAEEMEERDLHYRSVISTRKHAVESINPIIEPGDDSSQALEIAADITDTILGHPTIDILIKDALDGLGKGYSVNEILWDTSESQWAPKAYRHRDPRWFEYDRESGRRLLLRSISGTRELTPYKYIIHEPHLKSGLPIRAGLALPVAYYYLIKSYDLAGWAAFVEVFGYPLRLGRYNGRAGKKDLEILRRAVRDLGRDVGAIIPKDMEIEILNGVQGRGNIDLFEKLAAWVDKQISKGVLGQTMSADAEGGQYKGDLHNEVRQEIRESDAGQLAATLNRDLIRPYVEFNYGKQKSYPKLRLPVPRPENIPALVDALDKLVRLGFRVKIDELYRKLGLSRPDDDDEVLRVPAAPGATALNREEPARSNELEAIMAEAESDWISLAAPVRDALNQVAEECESFDEMLEKLPGLVGRLNTENTAETLSAATLKARAIGDKEAFEE